MRWSRRGDKADVTNSGGGHGRVEEVMGWSETAQMGGRRRRRSPPRLNGGSDCSRRQRCPLLIRAVQVNGRPRRAMAGSGSPPRMYFALSFDILAIYKILEYQILNFLVFASSFDFQCFIKHYSIKYHEIFNILFLIY